MRTVPLAALCLAAAVSCRCDERPNLVPPSSSEKARVPGPSPDSAPSSSTATTATAQTTPTTPTAPPTTPSTSIPAPATPTPTAPTARPLPLTSAVALEPSGSTALSASGENVVDPVSTFRVEIPIPLSEVRVVLTDTSGDHVPATSTREVAETTRVDLAPSKPLVPASRYVLRVEGSSGADIQGADGTSFAPAAIPLVAAGSPPPPPEPPRKKRRR